ncbi:uroporphyrinogen-III C-methyltransferase [Luteimicrobium subarcticum]|uniref:uroporphyrinogen-III C-methyltransferase n=1 Tax=Luteimicrobium subarcticum TaxID=620910 RepID=A0A2M8W770_9MICO|nr:uroporphyrin-III C-methyltransferase [Luteimicrobium subarcticum]
MTAARAEGTGRSTAPARVGRVVLVGGGPGDPDLLTLRAWRALTTADVVVTDRLGPRSVLDDLPPEVEVIDVGKTPGSHPVPQDRIDALIVHLARQGKTVVRLKGGDPFLFGRGGEEVAACRAAGVPVEVVPGVSSALAAPAAAGIPVTHRGVASSVQVVHGHEAVPAEAVAALAAGSTTLVVLMGVATLPDLAARALAGGVDPVTPCAVVERATTPSQRVTRCSLADLPDAAAAAGVRSPAVVVVGAVAAADLLGPVALRPELLAPAGR